MLLFSIVNYQVWLSTLPSLLCNKKISERIVDMLSLIARQNNGMFHQALIKRVPNILGNIFLQYKLHVVLTIYFPQTIYNILQSPKQKIKGWLFLKLCLCFITHPFCTEKIWSVLQTFWTKIKTATCSIL